MIANKTDRTALNCLLKMEGIYDELHTIVIREQLAGQLTALMKKKKLSKIRMAAAMKVSSTQLDRLIDPKSGGVKLAMLQKGANLVGKSLRVTLV